MKNRQNFLFQSTNFVPQCDNALSIYNLFLAIIHLRETKFLDYKLASIGLLCLRTHFSSRTGTFAGVPFFGE